MKNPNARKVTRRNESFVEKSQTKIWLEKPCEDNPYIAESVYCHGYNIFDLMKNCNLSQVIFLLCKGELPKPEQSELFEQLFIGMINPGPRHAATRAAMNAGVGKSHPVHVLPIASVVMGGERAAGQVEGAMRFFRKSFRKSPSDVARELRLSQGEEYWQSLPGFGQAYGGIDVHICKLANHLANLRGASEVLQWANEFSNILHSVSVGWLRTGLAAAVFSDLGLQPKFAGPLYQLMAAPGLIAHGLEMFTRPLTAMPYVKDENYVIQNPS